MTAANMELRIKDELHATKCIEDLHSLWQSQQLCDLTLKVGHSEFKVHKVVLVACCLYFKNMFTEELFVENGRNYVELFEIDADIFRSILEYFYSGYITLAENTVERILRMADFYGLTSLKGLCCEYLLVNINVKNCVKRYSLGVFYGFESLKGLTKTVIMQELYKVSKTPEFHAINEGILKELLTSRKESDKAEQLYNATMEWVRHDLDNRKPLLSDLLLLIPAKDISYEFYIENMKNDKILREDLKSTNWLLDNFIGANSCKTSIFATARSLKNPICYLLKPRSNELVNLPPRLDIIRFSAVYYQNHIYLTAGKIDDKNFQKSLKYNTCESKWSEVDLNFERCNSGSCILRDQLYIIGGVDKRDNSRQKCCIYYDFNSDRKFTMPEMEEGVELPGVGVYENSLYVCCGKTKNMNELSCIKRYDPREGKWYDVGKHNVAKGPCSSAVMCESLYTSILGKQIVESFDFRSNSSLELTKPTGAFSGWITSGDGKLYRADRGELSEYDRNNNQWLIKKHFVDVTNLLILSFDSTCHQQC